MKGVARCYSERSASDGLVDVPNVYMRGASRRDCQLPSGSGGAQWQRNAQIGTQGECGVGSGSGSGSREGVRGQGSGMRGRRSEPGPWGTGSETFSLHFSLQVSLHDSLQVSLRFHCSFRCSFHCTTRCREGSPLQSNEMLWSARAFAVRVGLRLSCATIGGYAIARKQRKREDVEGRLKHQPNCKTVSSPVFS